MYLNNGKIDIPLGLGMALTKDSEVLSFFSSLPNDQKQLIIDESKYMKSSEEMHELVKALSYDVHLKQ